MANDLLYAVAARDMKQLDEKLYLELFGVSALKPARSRQTASGRRVA
jgi:hypothetical protein